MKTVRAEPLGGAQGRLVEAQGGSLNVFKLHWLALANGAAFALVGIAFVAPVLVFAGYEDVAAHIYQAYGAICHQWASRSFFLLGPQMAYGAEVLETIGPAAPYTFLGSTDLGYKLAFCQRNLAVYGSILMGGLAFVRLRGQITALPFKAYLLLCAPIALDGFTQLLGWRESTWELRLLTGALFGLATVWFIYPRIDRVLRPRDPFPLPLGEGQGEGGECQGSALTPSLSHGERGISSKGLNTGREASGPGSHG